MQPTNSFKVLVGYSQALQVEGIIPELPIKVQGHTLYIPIFLWPIAGVEITLGASWLATLGAHIVDYSSFSI